MTTVNAPPPHAMDQSFGLSDFLPINPADDSIHADQDMNLSD